ncbi:plant self-incompatibility protein S1 family [Striga asiatica]|uniref:S-protein homolog n=1 Tax=Striga asiatica TaxID=4170 RepID=A0A5A7R3D2_STRAF|nr:plant self-incompatibility protein S1 family [Striga asiatica]
MYKSQQPDQNITKPFLSFSFHSRMKSLILLFIFLGNIFKIKGFNKDPCQITERFEVHVINRLPYPKLELHCASGNDDLGFHHVVPNYDFNWSFCDGYTGRTLFFCHLWWQNKEIAWDVFTSKHRGQCGSGKCLWEATTDGIYFGDGTNGFEKRFDWQNRKSSSLTTNEEKTPMSQP